MKKIRKNIVLGTACCMASAMTACAPIVAGPKADFTKGKSGSVIKGYAYDVTNLPVKDFEVVKLVFARDIMDETNKTPPTQIWHSLLIKAQEAGAHAIINVNIEESKACITVINNEGHDKKCLTTRYGSALAIRYTDTMTGNDNEFKNTVLNGNTITGSLENKYEEVKISDENSRTSITKSKEGQVIKGYSFDVTTLPMKNYEPVQLVFSRAVLDDSMNTPPSMLYHDLLIKAAEAGAHAVININIEETKFCSSLEDSTGASNKQCQLVRYGAGLAIKYTNTITKKWDEVATNHKTEILPPQSKEETNNNMQNEKKTDTLFGKFNK